MKDWKHLTLEQRKVISNGISHNYKLKEIAETKLPDLNAYTVEEAMKIVEGTAKNMGIEITD